MTFPRILGTCAFWVCALAPCAAAERGLVFESTTLEQRAKPEDDELIYRFPFRVAGERTVTIKEIRALCDCLQITTDRTTYRPGEHGVVTATLKLGTFEGALSKSFNLVTDDPQQKRLLLRCVAHLPPMFDFSALSVRWKTGSMPEPQTVRMSVVAEKPIKVLKVASTQANVLASFKEIRPGREYEITLSPKSTDAVQTGLVSIETDSPIKKFSRRLLFFHILPRN